MFEKAVLRRQGNNGHISVGQIAEAMLYYQDVRIIMDPGSMKQLMDQVGVEEFMTIVGHPALKIDYCEEMLAVASEPISVLNIYDYKAIMLSGDKDVGSLNTVWERVAHAFKRQGLSSRKASKYATEFLRIVNVKRPSGDIWIKGGIHRAAKLDLNNMEFLRQAIRAYIHQASHGVDVGDGFKLDYIDTPIGFYLLSDIDFKGINQGYADKYGYSVCISMDGILASLIDTCADLIFASTYGGDLLTSDMNSKLLHLRNMDILRRTHMSSSEIKEFSEIVLPKSPSLAEVLDSKEKSFSEFLHLLDKAQKFKDWVAKLDSDEKLVSEYISAVTSDRGLQSMRVKLLRYCIGVATCFLPNSISTVAAASWGGLDGLVMDKFSQGWRLNRFVNTQLKPFVGTRDPF